TLADGANFPVRRRFRRSKICRKSAGQLPEDLGERAMLGDAGANALGALLGLAAAVTLGRPGRLAALGTVAALTAASEKVSFTKVIAGNPVLNRIDMLGRRPPEQAPAG
ncbi:hypothetical protein ACWDR9_39120, partial [Streptosporangium sandarakinum]